MNEQIWAVPFPWKNPTTGEWEIHHGRMTEFGYMHISRTDYTSMIGMWRMQLNKKHRAALNGEK